MIQHMIVHTEISLILIHLIKQPTCNGMNNIHRNTSVHGAYNMCLDGKIVKTVVTAYNTTIVYILMYGY